MEKLKKTDKFQLFLIILMVGMSIFFSILYPITMSKVGYDYNGTILVPTEENGNTIYAGIMDGYKVKFVVSDEKVEFYCGDESYGPYTLKEDSTAIPNDHQFSSMMKGIEIKEKDTIIFRGGVLPMGDDYWLYNQNGDSYHTITGVLDNGLEIDENGNPIDDLKPTLNTLIELINGPKLTHKGYGFAWFGGIAICILNILLIVFADEIFRFNLSFQIRDAENAEPSEWEIAGRYFGWIWLVFVALYIFVLGLK